MTRIVGGAAGGRRLAVPPGRDVRPTSDRTREALFGTLATMLDLTGARVLDLYAGSGAVGLEAVSRGAAHALLVESDARTAAAAGANAETLGVADRVTVLRARVERVLASPPNDARPTANADGENADNADRLAHGVYQLAFADPPYALSEAEVDDMLRLLADGWLAPDAIVVVERSSRGAGPTWPSSLEPVKQRRYGEGTLWYGRRT